MFETERLARRYVWRVNWWRVAAVAAVPASWAVVAAVFYGLGLAVAAFG
jgi:hypothetical protein